MKIFFKLLLLSFLFLQNINDSKAHNPDQSYLYFSIFQDRIDGRFEITENQLNNSLGINLKKEYSKEDLLPHLPVIQQYILDNVAISSKLGSHEIKFTDVETLFAGPIGTFALLHFELDNVTEIPDEVIVKYDMFFNEDKKHRALLLQAYNWKAGIINNEAMHSAIFTPKNTTQTLDLSKKSLWKGFVAMVKMGVWHIWIGIDHILFLVALILPAVVWRRKEKLNGWSNTLNQWKGVDGFKQAFFYILKVITFFTIAHTITLSLATLNIINLPSRIVETIIALSIALAAFHNIKPIFGKKEWLIAFIFGLFHGFGFAGVLAEKGLGGDYMMLSLFGFNLGVEIGQVLIILVLFPILFLIRKAKGYSPLVIVLSILLIFISIYWGIERFFEVDLPLGRWIGDLIG